jgi:hypothetical protein
MLCVDASMPTPNLVAMETDNHGTDHFLAALN